MHPVQFSLYPPSARYDHGGANAPTEGSYASSLPVLVPVRASFHGSYPQAQTYLAQSIAQEYLQSGLTIEPHAQANAAYRRRVAPVPLINFTT